MSDASIDINLNDTTTQLFDAGGQPLPTQPAVSGMADDVAELYAAMVESFEERIRTSPEAQADQLGSTIADELDDLTQALGNGGVNGPVGTGGGGGSGGDPPDPPDDPADEPLDPGEPNDPSGTEPPEPPNDPLDEDIEIIDDDLADGADEATDTASGAGALIGGPLGGGLIVLATGIDLVISAFEGLEEVINAVDDAMQSIVDDTRPFSGDVAFAAAMRDVTDILIKMDRANTLGPDIARWLETRTEIDLVLGKMATDVSQAMLPLVQSGTEALLDILTLISETVPTIISHFDKLGVGVEVAIPAVLGQFAQPLNELLGEVRTGTKVLRDEKIAKMAAAANETLQGFKQFLINEAMPIQPAGQLGVPQFIGGGLEP